MSAFNIPAGRQAPWEGSDDNSGVFLSPTRVMTMKKPSFPNAKQQRQSAKDKKLRKAKKREGEGW